jgi:hypothetical protein
MRRPLPACSWVLTKDARNSKRAFWQRHGKELQVKITLHGDRRLTVSAAITAILEISTFKNSAHRINGSTPDLSDSIWFL